MSDLSKAVEAFSVISRRAVALTQQGEQLLAEQEHRKEDNRMALADYTAQLEAQQVGDVAVASQPETIAESRSVSEPFVAEQQTAEPVVKETSGLQSKLAPVDLDALFDDLTLKIGQEQDQGMEMD